MAELLPALAGAALGPVAAGHAVPILVAQLGEQASWRYVEFFAAAIRNPNTRRAYLRATGRFLAWCDRRGLALATIRPFDVGAYVEMLGTQVAAPSVKQQLAAIRMLFDWMVVGQAMPTNPASVVRGPKQGSRHESAVSVRFTGTRQEDASAT